MILPQSINQLAAAILLLGPVPAFAQSNIDNSVPNKFSWGENVGWMNWRDANGATHGVHVGSFVMSGVIWGENIGWINVGDGTPAVAPHYANTTGADSGLNIDPNGDLHGMAWGENVGWINFDGGGMATPPQPARIECASRPGQLLARLNGYVWGENVGWINLADLTAGKFVALSAASTPLVCDMNHDGLMNGSDIQDFIVILLTADADWRDTCSGDLEPAATA